jgi:hypothetical protein
MKIWSLHQLGTSIQGARLQLWSLGYVHTAMIMCEGSESMSEMSANYCIHVLVIPKSQSL